MSLFILWLFLLCLNPRICYCEADIKGEEKTNIDDRFISTTIKLMAKAYIATADLEGIKKKQIEKIMHMEEKYFKTSLGKFCGELRGTPLEGIYGISGDSTREYVISVIKRLDKKEITKIVDCIPDKLVSDKVREYFASRQKTYSNKGDFLKNVKEAWSDTIKKLTP